MANFGEGLVQGFGTGAGVVQRNRQLGQQDRQLEQTQQQAQREQLQGQLDVVNQTLDAFRSTVTEAAKNVGPERAKQFLSDPRFQAQIAQAVGVRNAFMSQLGFSGGASANAEEVIAQMTRLADTQPSAAEEGTREGVRQKAEFAAGPSAEDVGARQGVIEGTAALANLEVRLGREPTEQERALDAGVNGSFNSPLGKLIDDQAKAIKMYGEGSPQANAFNDLIEQESTPEAAKPKLTDIRGLRTDYTSASQDFIDVQAAFNRMVTTPDDATGDIALVYNFFGVVEPGGRVTDGEFGTAGRAAGLSEQLVRGLERLDSGRGLTSEQRKGFIEVGRNAYLSALEIQRNNEEIYGDIAQRQRMPIEEAVPSFIIESIADKQPVARAAPNASPTILVPELDVSDEELQRFIDGLN